MKCSTVKRDGTNCGGIPLASGLCWAHDPAVRDRADAARRKGGENKANARRAAKHIPADMKALASQLMEAITECYAGDLEPRRLTAMGTAAGAIVRIHETAELEGRLEELERRAEVGQQRRTW